MIKLNKTRQVTAASQYKFPGESGFAVGSNGELNASDKKDLLARSAKFVEAVSAGEVVRDADLEAAHKAALRNTPIKD